MAILKIFGDGFADAPGKLPPQINFELVDGMLRPCEALSFESFEAIPDFAWAGRVPKTKS